jgi:glutamate---cysteine ligase / carboxylate-amine ligase
VQERLGAVDGTVERELHACQIELITDVCRTAGEAVVAL